jgi:hypothetical protein
MSTMLHIKSYNHPPSPYSKDKNTLFTNSNPNTTIHYISIKSISSNPWQPKLNPDQSVKRTMPFAVFQLRRRTRGGIPQSTQPP